MMEKDTFTCECKVCKKKFEHSVAAADVCLECFISSSDESDVEGE